MSGDELETIRWAFACLAALGGYYLSLRHEERAT